MSKLLLTVKDLNRSQIEELKQDYIDMKNREAGIQTSMYDIFNADELVSDKEIYTYYDGYTFTLDDFWSTAGLEKGFEKIEKSLQAGRD